MKKQGFTLIELVVAIAILGVISLIAIPSVNKIQSSNKKAKFIAYEKSIINSSKAYVDAFNEDLFGIDNTGCAIITYEDLKERDLVSDLQIANSDCSNKDLTYPSTYTIVHKNNKENYHYEVHLFCRNNKTNEILYGVENLNNLSNICKLEDDKGPTLTINYTSEYASIPFYIKNQAPKLKVTIRDVGVGLKENQVVKYKWYKNNIEIPNTEQTIYFKNKNYALSTSKFIVNPPEIEDTSEDTLYKVVFDGTLEDINGNKNTHTYEDKVWSKSIIYAAINRCDGYVVKTSGNQNASTSKWYKDYLNVRANFKTNNIEELEMLNVEKYKLYQSENSDSYTLVNNNVQAEPNDYIKTGETTNGKIKYKVEYKIKGSNDYKECPESSDYQLDHIAPTITFDNKNDGYTLNAIAKDTLSGVTSYKWIGDNDQTITPTSSTTLTKNMGTANGANTTFYATDAAGNTSSANTPTYKWCDSTKKNGILPTWNEVDRVGSQTWAGAVTTYTWNYKSRDCSRSGSHVPRRNYNLKEYGCQCNLDKHSGKYCSYSSYRDYTTATHTNSTATIYYQRTDNGAKACKGDIQINQYVDKVCKSNMGNNAYIFIHGYYFYKNGVGGYNTFSPGDFWHNWYQANPNKRISSSNTVSTACSYACQLQFGTHVSWIGPVP